MPAFMPDKYVQIDVKSSKDGLTHCNMYTGQRCVKIAMQESEYNNLVRDGFFNRDGKEADSADVINTTDVFIPQTQLTEAAPGMLDTLKSVLNYLNEADNIDTRWVRRVETAIHDATK